MVTVWSKRAKNELVKVFEHLSLESPQNARKVVDLLVELTLTLPDKPTKYPPDK